MKNFVKMLVLAISPMAISPTGAFAQSKFLDAAQIKPILTATKGSWVAVREYDGRDLLYFTHLMAWRCGLTDVSYALNDETEFTPWNIGTCDEEAANPNALADDQEIYMRAPLQSINKVTIRITYDDDTTDEAQYDRKSIQID